MGRTENPYEDFKKNEPQKYYAWGEGHDAKIYDTSKRIVDAIEYVQEIREIIDDKDAVLENVTAAVEILNGILRDETVFRISVRDPP